MSFGAFGSFVIRYSRVRSTVCSWVLRYCMLWYCGTVYCLLCIEYCELYNAHPMIHFTVLFVLHIVCTVPYVLENC